MANASGNTLDSPILPQNLAPASLGAPAELLSPADGATKKVAQPIIKESGEPQPSTTLTALGKKPDAEHVLTEEVSEKALPTSEKAEILEDSLHQSHSSEAESLESSTSSVQSITSVSEQEEQIEEDQNAFITYGLINNDRASLLDFTIKEGTTKAQELFSQALDSPVLKKGSEAVKEAQKFTRNVVLCAATLMKTDSITPMEKLLEKLSTTLTPFLEGKHAPFVLDQAFALIPGEHFPDESDLDYFQTSANFVALASAIKTYNTNLAFTALNHVKENYTPEEMASYCKDITDKEQKFLHDSYEKSLCAKPIMEKSLTPLLSKYTVERTAQIITSDTLSQFPKALDPSQFLQEMIAFAEAKVDADADNAAKTTTKKLFNQTLVTCLAEIKIQKFAAAEESLPPKILGELIDLASQKGISALSCIQSAVRNLEGVSNQKKENFLLSLYVEFLKNRDVGKENADLKQVQRGFLELSEAHVDIQTVIDRGFKNDPVLIEQLHIAKVAYALEKKDGALYRSEIGEKKEARLSASLELLQTTRNISPKSLRAFIQRDYLIPLMGDAIARRDTQALLKYISEGKFKDAKEFESFTTKISTTSMISQENVELLFSDLDEAIKTPENEWKSEEEFRDAMSKIDLPNPLNDTQWNVVYENILQFGEKTGQLPSFMDFATILAKLSLSETEERFVQDTFALQTSILNEMQRPGSIKISLKNFQDNKIDVFAVFAQAINSEPDESKKNAARQMLSSYLSEELHKVLEESQKNASTKPLEELLQKFRHLQFHDKSIEQSFHAALSSLTDVATRENCNSAFAAHVERVTLAANLLALGSLCQKVLTGASLADQNATADALKASFIASLQAACLTGQNDQIQYLFSKYPEIQAHGVQTSIEDSVKEALSGLKSMPGQTDTVRFLERIQANVAMIQKVPYQHHRMHVLDIFKVSAFAEHELSQIGQLRPDILYLSGKITGLPRGIMIDFANHEFAILSKKFGELEKYGTVKKVTDAVLVSGTLDALGAYSVTAERYARKTNKGTKKFGLDELTYEHRYGGSKLVTRYGTALHPLKICYLSKPYPSNLFDVHQILGAESIPPAYLNSIMKQIGATVSLMHGDGVLHWDIKNINVLLDADDKGVKVLLSDFDKSHQPLLGNTIAYYQTSQVSGPEFFDIPHYFDTFAAKEWLERGKAADMFALGCLMYFVVSGGNNVPWADSVGNYVNAEYLGQENEELREAASKDYSDGIAAIVKASGNKAAPDYGQRQIMLRLLERDPLKRYTIEKYKEACSLCEQLTSGQITVDQFDTGLGNLDQLSLSPAIS